jgi:hypothetical protein
MFPSLQLVLDLRPLPEGFLGLFLISPEVFLREGLIELLYLRSENNNVKDNL